MNTDLHGGETIRIASGGQNIHTFRRALSEALERMHADSDEPRIDTWILVDPMSAQQTRKLRLQGVAKWPHLEPQQFDTLKSPEEQSRRIWEAVEENKKRDRVNARRGGAVNHGIGEKAFITIESAIDESGDRVDHEWYELGSGIPRIRTWKMWRVLDEIARSALMGSLPQGVRFDGDAVVIEADTLARTINRTLAP